MITRGRVGGTRQKAGVGGIGDLIAGILDAVLGPITKGVVSARAADVRLPMAYEGSLVAAFNGKLSVAAERTIEARLIEVPSRAEVSAFARRPKPPGYIPGSQRTPPPGAKVYTLTGKAVRR